MKLDLPTHVLVQIASHLDGTSLKALARSHSLLQSAAEVHLYRRLSLPLSNPHRAVYTPEAGGGGWECDYNLWMRWEPEKPDLAAALGERGWKEDVYRSNHLDASLRFITDCLGGVRTRANCDGDEPESQRGRRAKYPRELVIDCKKQYHDTELDMDTAASALAPDVPGQGIGAGHDGDGKDWHSDLGSEWAMAHHLARRRRDESPDRCPALRQTFDTMPILPGVKRVEVGLHESWQGYLAHVFRLVPNVEELVIRPDILLVDTPLNFDVDPAGGSDWDYLPKTLRSISVEPMLDCFQPLLLHLVNNNDQLEKVVMGDCQTGSRRKWTPSPALERSLHAAATHGRLRHLGVGRAARKVLLQDTDRIWPDGVLAKLEV